MDAGPFQSSHALAFPRYGGLSPNLQDFMILRDFELVDYMTDGPGQNYDRSGDSNFTSPFDDCSHPLTSPYNPTAPEWSSNTGGALFGVRGWADGCGAEWSDPGVASFGPSHTNGPDWSSDGLSLFDTPYDTRSSDEHPVRQNAFSRVPYQGPSVASTGVLKAVQATKCRSDAAVSNEPITEPSNKCLVPGCGRGKKPFQRQDQLKRHLREIHGEAKFVCGSCDKKFTRRYGFRHHLRKSRHCRDAQEGQGATG